MTTRRIRVLELSGSHYEMGLEHGRRYADTIREFAEERVALSSDPAWTGTGVGLSRAEVLALADACLDEHRRYAPDLLEELRGMADATGLTLAELVIVGGFTDFVDTVHGYSLHGAARTCIPAHAGADNCTAFIVPDGMAEGGMGFYGQTWDMHATATPHVLMLRGAPEGKPAFLAFTTVGCVGMIGMNDAGICVGINNLAGADGQVGVTWPFVVRKILEQTDLEAALACITEATLSGAHNYLLFDAEGRGYNVEAMSTTRHVTELDGEALIHTNHCLAPHTVAVQRPRDPLAQASSEARLTRARDLLAEVPITLEDLQALTRDPAAICVRATPPKDVETCGAMIMRPKTLDAWAVWGLPSENEYESFSLV
jgi:isopenicillin-N N-acyltransferase like protein